MPHRRSWFVVAAVVAAWLSLSAGSLRAAQPVDFAAVRTDAGPKVCVVTAEGALGLPVARASGFLLGEGKFVVTDLACAAQPGVKQMIFRFRDGSAAAGREFGMADPTLGVVVIKLDEPKTSIGGLALAAAVPPEGGAEALIIGWKAGQDLAVAAGTLKTGASTADLAVLLKLDPPKTAATFLTFAGGRADVTSGSPVLDGTGSVAGVLLDVAGVDRPIVVPASLVRSALLAAGAHVKPLAELPKPIWPVALPSLIGKAATPAEFAACARAARIKSRCAACDGKGQVIVKKLVGTQRTLMGIRNIYREEAEPCKTCAGEGIVCGEGLYSVFANMAYDAAWLISSPDVDLKAKDAAMTVGTSMLSTLARVGHRYRNAFVSQANADLGKATGEFPRGIVVYARVDETIDGPDGRYTLLLPHASSATVVVKAEHLMPPPATDGKPAAAAPPAPGAWVVLGGAAEGMVALQSYRSVLVRPFGWTPGPALGRGPVRPGPGPGPGPSITPPEPPRPRTGEPDFFGL